MRATTYRDREDAEGRLHTAGRPVAGSPRGKTVLVKGTWLCAVSSTLCDAQCRVAGLNTVCVGGVEGRVRRW